MKIMIFLHGTAIMHKNALGKTREERVNQVKNKEKSVYDYAHYVPVGDVVRKLRAWESQGAVIMYLSSHRIAPNVQKDKQVLNTWHFPNGEVFYRKRNESYATVAERVMPDILIEDDCESIGGKKEMTYPHIRPDIQKCMKSIVVREFAGVDDLPDLYTNL